MQTAMIGMEHPENCCLETETLDYHVREESGGQIELSRGEKAKEGAKTASYSLVILAGLGMCATVFYTVFRLANYTPLAFHSSILFFCCQGAFFFKLCKLPV